MHRELLSCRHCSFDAGANLLKTDLRCIQHVLDLSVCSLPLVNSRLHVCSSSPHSCPSISSIMIIQSVLYTVQNNQGPDHPQSSPSKGVSFADPKFYGDELIRQRGSEMSLRTIATSLFFGSSGSQWGSGPESRGGETSKIARGMRGRKGRFNCSRRRWGM